MKKLISLILFFISGFIILITSCKKDPVATSTPCTTCQKVTEAKDYFAFKVGSWWVYEEETSLERDSMYVTSSTISDGYNFDTYIYSDLQGYYYHYWPTYAAGSSYCSETNPVNGKCLYVKRSKYKPGDFIGEDNCFFIVYKLGDFVYAYNNIYYVNNKVSIDQILEEYVLNSINFSKTVKIHELSTLVEGIQPTNHYFSKGVGLVRKELIDSNKVWNLVNYHIEP